MRSGDGLIRAAVDGRNYLSEVRNKIQDGGIGYGTTTDTKQDIRDSRLQGDAGL